MGSASQRFAYCGRIDEGVRVKFDWMETVLVYGIAPGGGQAPPGGGQAPPGTDLHLVEVKLHLAEVRLHLLPCTMFAITLLSPKSTEAGVKMFAAAAAGRRWTS